MTYSIVCKGCGSVISVSATRPHCHYRIKCACCGADLDPIKNVSASASGLFWNVMTSMINTRSDNIVQILSYDSKNLRALFKSPRRNCSTDCILKDIRNYLDGFRMNRSEGKKTDTETFEQMWVTPEGKVEALIRRRAFNNDVWELEFIVRELSSLRPQGL